MFIRPNFGITGNLIGKKCLAAQKLAFFWHYREGDMPHILIKNCLFDLHHYPQKQREAMSPSAKKMQCFGLTDISGQ
jgi:hypothetical protein